MRLKHQKPRSRRGSAGPLFARIATVVVTVATLHATACRTAPPESSVIEGKFTPPADRTLLIIGQDLESIAGYVRGTGAIPGGVTTYTDISEENQEYLLYGLEDTVDWGAGPVSARALVDRYPHSALVIGLYLVDRTGTNLAHVVDGSHDGAIERLGSFISEAARPVYLRIGYEFDGPWNHYEPGLYKAAFRHIIDRLRAAGVTNVATVWQSATAPSERFGGHPLAAWYPGDDYVDWFGSSYFIFDRAAHDSLLALARRHAKPVMIAEAAPQGYDLRDLSYSPVTDGKSFERRTPEEIWDEWFRPFFAYVRLNSDVIRAVAYINADWHGQRMWGPDGVSGYWGDSRVEVDPEIRSRWLAETARDFWLHGGPGLPRQLRE